MNLWKLLSFFSFGLHATVIREIYFAMLRQCRRLDLRRGLTYLTSQIASTGNSFSASSSYNTKCHYGRKFTTFAPSSSTLTIKVTGKAPLEIEEITVEKTDEQGKGDAEVIKGIVKALHERITATFEATSPPPDIMAVRSKLIPFCSISLHHWLLRSLRCLFPLFVELVRLTVRGIRKMTSTTERCIVS